MLRGLMMDRPMMISGILDYAAEIRGDQEVISARVEGDRHRTTYAEVARRAAQLAHALKALGIRQSDRVATLAWNGYRHLELYYAISGIGGVTTWRDAAEFMALGAGNVQVCTAAMTYGFKIVEEMISGLSQWMDEKGHTSTQDFIGQAVPNVTDWNYLNLNHVTKARIDQDMCIKCGRCYAACEDTSHQAISMSADRVFEVKDDECVACNLCVNVCPVEDCITMVTLEPGQIDERTGKVVEEDYANWTTHPNNPGAQAAE